MTTFKPGGSSRCAVGALALLSVIGSASAAPLTLATVPLFLGGLLQPNLMLTIDDSSSMAWSYMPDSIGLDNTNTAVNEDLIGTKRGLAAERNALAYNPAVSYDPPLLGTGGTNLTSFAAALNDGFDSTKGTTALGSGYWPSWKGDNDYTTIVTAAGPAFYYVFYANHPSAVQGLPANCDTTGVDGGLDDDDCYVPVVVSSSSGSGGTDETQNFANWYSYYRKRMYAVKSAARIALDQLGNSTRVGIGKLGDSDTIVYPVDIFTDTATSTHRTNVLTALGNIQPATPGDTPLRRAADDVGQYFMQGRVTFANNNPWRDVPSSSSSGTTSCRRSYHLLMSDGYWNGAPAITNGARADNDDPPSGALSIGDNAVVSPSTTPGDTLADVAAYYWMTDLDGNSANNNLPTSAFNPQSQQHLVTVALGVGLEPTSVDPQQAFAALTDSSIAKPVWPTLIVPNSPQTLDDFLHAAVNSRADYVDVSVPADLVGTLSRIVTGIPGTGSSSASVVLNSGALRSDTRLYQARFDSADWSGELLAYEVINAPTNISQDGQIGSLIWDAGAKLTAQSLSSRHIATYKIALKNNATLDANNSGPAEFQWSELSDAQKTALGTAVSGTFNTNNNNPDGLAMVAYLRGSGADESPSGRKWRKRNSLLGDIVNAAPAYLGPPSTLYPDIWQNTDATSTTSPPENAKPYSLFRAANSTRKSILFAGANDGMLHAFEAAVWDSANNKWVDGSGGELYAYVPGTVVKSMDDLANTNYGSGTSTPHRYFVDGSPTVGDAFFETAGQWRSVLVSGLGAGGQAVFALDVTSPNAATDADVKAKVLWEYTDLHRKELGNTFSQPNIVRIPYGKGKWVALFGNGFNNTFVDGAQSTKGEAMLIAVDLESGAEVNIWGTPTSANSTSPPNGLATVVPIDMNGDFTADYAYAGDLQGNLWRFDLATNGDGTLIYKARDSANNPQPITTRPSVMRHPDGPGVLVLFGTGRYIDSNDAQATSQLNAQSFYAVWDKDLTVTSSAAQVPSATRGSTSSTLLQRKILAEVTGADGFSYRVTTTNGSDPILWKTSNTVGKHLGWFMDLYNTANNNTSHNGERQVSDSIVRGGKVIFTTLIPNANACAFGGDGWLMELDAATGGQPAFAIFDINKNGVFGLGDFVSVPQSAGGGTAAPSGRKNPGIGIVPMPAILSRAGGEKEFKYMSGSSGQVDVVAENPGKRNDFARETWQQHGVLE